MKTNLQNAKRKPKILITFRENGVNGGPYVSHQRIVSSTLKDKYEFVPLMIPIPKEILRPPIFWKYVCLIRKEKADVLHFSGLQLEGFCVLLLAKVAGQKKTICAIHGSSMEAIKFKGWKRRVTCVLENWTLRHSSVTYCVSEFVANWPRVKKYSNKCFGYIYNLPFVSMEKKTPHIQGADIRKEYGIAEDDLVVVSTGRITEDKGFAVLTETILSRAWDRIHFLIVGEGEYLPEMKARIKSSNLRNSVHFTGYRKEIEHILKRSDIFVICTYHETLCNSVIEASACGLPVIATNTGGIPEIVENEVSGILTKPGNSTEVCDAIERLISDSDMRCRMGKCGQKIIQDKFDTDMILESLDKLYEETIALS